MNRDGVLDLVGGEADALLLRIIYSVPEPCPGDLTLDGTLNFFDVTLFMRMYFEQRPLADLNHDGNINAFDFSVLYNAFQSGCP